MLEPIHSMHFIAADLEKFRKVFSFRFLWKAIHWNGILLEGILLEGIQ